MYSTCTVHGLGESTCKLLDYSTEAEATPRQRTQRAETARHVARRKTRARDHGGIVSKLEFRQRFGGRAPRGKRAGAAPGVRARDDV